MADLAATTAQKVETAKQKKETGDQAFKAGLAKEGEDLQAWDVLFYFRANFWLY